MKVIPPPLSKPLDAARSSTSTSSSAAKMGSAHGVAGISSAKVDAAYAFAARAHGDQQYGTEPYTVHLQEVMAGCVRMGFVDDTLLMAAALHDVIEDTPVVQAAIAIAFGRDVAELVAQLSHDWRTETSVYLAGMSDGAFSVKLADRLANVERMGQLENSPDRAAYLMAKYGPEMGLFADEAQRRGLQGPFAVLEAAFAHTENAIRGAVDAYTLQQGVDRVEEKKAQKEARLQAELQGADGSASGSAFVAEMGGKKTASSTSPTSSSTLSPMMAVRTKPN